MDKINIFSGTSHPDLAKKISMRLGIGLSSSTIKKFSDSETYVKINEDVRGSNVFVIQSIYRPVNDSLVELLIIIDALRRASAGKVNVVMPYMAYARQDRKAEPREPITAKLVANLLTRSGADRVITMDLHANQIQGFFDIPVDHFYAHTLFAKYIENKGYTNVVAVSPDTGSVKKVRNFAKLIKSPIAIIDKRRPDHNKTEVLHVVGDVKGKTAVIMDDMIDTGGTMIGAVDALLANGALEVHICASHGVFSGNAVSNLMKSKAKTVVVTDSLPLPDFEKLEILSITALLSKIITRVHGNQSVSELFTGTLT